MEILGLIVGLSGLGVLAMRFGRDSRPTLHSEEQRLASLGLVWDGKPDAAGRSSSRRNGLATARANGVVRSSESSATPSRVVAHPVRHRLAAGLYRLADWLYPGVSEPRRLPQRSTSM
jgi:hypothetical protein